MVTEVNINLEMNMTILQASFFFGRSHCHFKFTLSKIDRKYKYERVHTGENSQILTVPNKNNYLRVPKFFCMQLVSKVSFFLLGGFVHSLRSCGKFPLS
jgi:hypothetical protein